MNAVTNMLPRPEDMALTDRDKLFEIVQGQRVELEPMGAFDTDIASILLGYVWPFSQTNKLGRVVSEMLFEIDAATGLQRRPDVAFVSYERWPR